MKERRHPLGDRFLAAFAPPAESVTFDDLAEVAGRHDSSLAEALVWLATAQAGDVVREGGTPGARFYVLTDRGRAILEDDPREQRRGEPAAVGGG